MQNICAVSSLAPYAPTPEQWTASKVKHLYRRIGYGASYDQIMEGLSLSPTELVDNLLNTALSTPIPDTPFWSDYTSDEYEDNFELYYEHQQSVKYDWVARSFTNPFQAKMALFWHDHFATEKGVYGCNSSMWYYFKLLNEEAFGNFRSFVEKMGINKAMLVYLDGNDNIASQPNENYARELMELFTMGEGNGYTQTDIEEVARALTGYRMQQYNCTDVYYDESYHDADLKTIFGQTGNFNYDDVHELIFTLRADETAQYICTKLYQHFVYHEPNKEIVNELAETFKTNNWEIAPVIEQLLKSEHFYDDSLIGSRIKHPIELIVNLLTPIGVDVYSDFQEGFLDYSTYSSEDMGMELFDPPNVAGWPGHRIWLSENALTYRWTFCSTIIRYYLNGIGGEKLRQLALLLSGGSNDPVQIASDMADHFLAINLDPELKEVATLFLKAGIPENYFDDGSWNLNWEEATDQLINLLAYFIQIPEMQLA